MFPYSIQQSISEMKGQADESIQQDEGGSATEHPPAAAGMPVGIPPAAQPLITVIVANQGDGHC